MFHTALLYDELDAGLIQCNLCAHRCRIREGSRGICQVRENRGGKLFTLVYGYLIAQNVDPIEKKPLYHFMPGSNAYSIATPGCNFRCRWCQNWQISQLPRGMEMPDRKRVMPEIIVKTAIKSNCQTIAYTYTEPTIFFEYSLDTARLARQEGLKNVFVSNGFMSPEMLDMIEPYLDGANIDIKAFSDETYRSLMGGKLQPVLDSCRKMKSMGVWLEITTLIVPGVNDDLDELKALASFIYHDLGSETPWHLSRFYPQYKMADSRPTEDSLLYKTRAIGKSIGLNYIYLGNIFADNQTYCKECGSVLISRNGYSTHLAGLDENGDCKLCGIKLDGLMN